MGKKKKPSGTGFSTTSSAPAPKQQVAKSSRHRPTLEQQAFALIKQGRLREAEAIYRDLVAAGSTNYIVYGNLAALCVSLGRFDEHVGLLSKALELKPDYPEAHYNLGHAYAKQGDFKAAIASFNKALELKPDFPEACNSLGNVLVEQGDLDAAIGSYNKALKAKPGNLSTLWHLALTHLSRRDYKQGWKTFEARFATGIKLDAKPQCPPWKGESLTKDKPLLLVSEQGYGDTLQFMRYVVHLRHQGVEVSLCVPKKLHSLVKASGVHPQPMTPEEANSVTDGFHTPLMSLPRQLGVTPENPLITKPYINATIDQETRWREALARDERPIIGIHWQGNPAHEKSNLRGRSLSLETFAPITATCHASLLSLQKGFGSEQLESCSFRDRFVSCQDQVNETWDFLETAAIISNCDLVITNDTAIAHLAGGMGKTTWLLLHKVPDWRWGLDGDTTFWYPSMRLFRQKDHGDWAGVMQCVAEKLQENFEGFTRPESVHASKEQLLHAITAPISLGELVDKITILQIKTQHLTGVALENVMKELDALEATLKSLRLNIDSMLIQQLKDVNQDLWQIEDKIRDQERENIFDDTFIRLARSVYRQNDLRAAIKKRINITYGSAIVEEKSYQEY